MKINFFILCCLLFVCGKADAQETYYVEDSAKVNAQIESDLCEWAQHNAKLLKKVSFGRDSSETYWVDKKTNMLVRVVVFHSPQKRSSQAIHYLYLHDKLFWISFSERKQGKMLIMKNFGSGVYYFSENTLIYKKEDTETKRTADLLISNSKIYFASYLKYLNEMNGK